MKVYPRVNIVKSFVCLHMFFYTQKIVYPDTFIYLSLYVERFTC